MSMFSRCLYFIALERPLFTASILASRRRAGPLTQIKAGNEDWEPTPNELDSLAQAFIEAEEDAVSAVMVTRNDVDINRAVTSIASDLWKISDEYAFISEGKMKALGISDALLSGDASFSTTEMALSVMLDRIRAHRTYMTESIIINKICREVALANDFRKVTKAQLDHKIRVKGSDDEDEEDLQLPSVSWHKQLKPTADDAAINLLTTAEEKGLPVGIRDWAAATGFALESSLENMDEDLKLRQKIATYKQQVAKFSPTGADAGGGIDSLLGGGGGGDEGAPPEGQEGQEGGDQVQGKFSPQQQEKIHAAIHNDAIRKFVHLMPIWDHRGMCIDIHKEEAIEKLHDPEFLKVVSEGHNWLDLAKYLASQYQWSQRKVDVFGYVMFRLGLVRTYSISSMMIEELSGRLKKEGSSRTESLSLIRELQFLSSMSRLKKEVKGSSLGNILRMEDRIPSQSILTGNTGGTDTKKSL
jgi:hypothetical protein